MYWGIDQTRGAAGGFLTAGGWHIELITLFCPLVQMSAVPTVKGKKKYPVPTE